MPASAPPTPDARYADFLDRVRIAPALSDYTHRMWMRHQDALARAIAQDLGVTPDDVRSAALARFTLETSALVHHAEDPERAVDVAFDLLEHGWNAPAPRFDDSRDWPLPMQDHLRGREDPGPRFALAVRRDDIERCPCTRCAAEPGSPAF